METSNEVVVAAACCSYYKHNEALRDTQTLRAGCSKAEPKKIRPATDPSRGRRTAKI